MKQRLRTALLVLLALVFTVSVARMLYQFYQYQQGEEVYSEAEELVNLPDLSDFPPASVPDDSSAQGDSSEEEAPVYVDPYADALRNMDFAALREVNSDVLGWILIPGTNLSYPLVQGDDNSYYLNHTWRKGRNSVGAIFLECTNSSDLSDFNTIIYGHRMNNRSMFGTLHSYKDQSYWSKHPYVYITDDSGSHKYEIFAAYEVSVLGDTYQLGFSSDQSKQSFLDYCMAQSVIDTGVVPTVYDRILTLSTCTGNGHATRWVVQAVLKGVAPSDAAQQMPEEPAVEEPATPEPTQPPVEPPVEEPAASPSASTSEEEQPISQDISSAAEEQIDSSAVEAEAPAELPGAPEPDDRPAEAEAAGE